MFNTNVSGHNKIWGCTAPERLPLAMGLDHYPGALTLWGQELLSVVSSRFQVLKFCNTHQRMSACCSANSTKTSVTAFVWW